jgi:hypothetical protein
MKSIVVSTGGSRRVRRCIAVSLAALAGVGGMACRGARAEDRATRDRDPAADADRDAKAAAEAQRRQQIKQQATHWEQRFTKLLDGHLELLRTICGDLPRESRRAIAKAGEQAVKDAALRIAELRMGGRVPRGGQAGIVINGGNVVINGVARALQQAVAPEKRPGAAGETKQEKQPADPPGMIAAALAASVAEHVGREQATAFEQQVAQRKDRRREAVIREIVAALDGELFLSAEQRRTIEKALAEKWDDSMALSVQDMHVDNGVRVFPGVPDECVRPHLTAAQRERFRTQPRPNRRGEEPWQQQEWTKTGNMLDNLPPAGRDPWWFQ